MGRKLGRGLAPFCGGELRASPSNTKSPGLRPSSIPSGVLIHGAIWPQQIWAENWGLCPSGLGRAGSPSNTMWPGTRPTSLTSFVLIRPTVWPQCTNVADRQDRQTEQRSDSIRRTVLQTVAQKPTVQYSSSRSSYLRKSLVAIKDRTLMKLATGHRQTVESKQV